MNCAPAGSAQSTGAESPATRKEMTSPGGPATTVMAWAVSRRVTVRTASRSPSSKPCPVRT